MARASVDPQRAIRVRFSTVTLLLLLATMLSGCTDGPDDVDPIVQSVRQRIQDTQPVDPFAAPEVGPDGTCEGCIRLRSADDITRIDPLPAHPEPVRRDPDNTTPPPLYRIPFPRAGDIVDVAGFRAAEDGNTLPERLVADDDGSYAFVLHWREPVADAPGSQRGEGDPIRVDVTGTGTDTQQAQDAVFGTFDIDPFTWYVSPVNRLAVGAVAEVQNSQAGPAGMPLAAERAHGTRTWTPASADLYWLGSHFWGRSFSGPTSFTTHWTTPGADAPTVTFDHEILRIDDQTARRLTAADAHHASAGAPPTTSTQIEGRTTAVDIHGNQVRWSFTLDPTTPYPVELSRTMVRLRSMETTELPLMVRHQETHLAKRGDTELPFLSRHIQTRAAVEGDARFHLHERDVPPALGTLPAYPLGLAEADLQTFDQDFRQWRSNGCILVAATLERIDAVSTDDRTGIRTATGEPPRLQWVLRYVDGQGNAQAWQVARPYEPAVGIGPVPISFGTTNVGYVPPATADLQRHQLWAHQLATGDVTVQAVKAAGWDGPVDTVQYRLVVSPDRSEIGGRLLVAHRPPDLWLSGTSDDATYHTGSIHEDLATGMIDAQWSLDLKTAR